MVFYSISHSAEENYQAQARIERSGQKHPMFMYYLLCKESIDEDIYNVVASKQANQDKLLDQAAASQEILKLWRDREKTYGKKRKNKTIQK
jgi:SNF2 family DNA or RNA helicase